MPAEYDLLTPRFCRDIQILMQLMQLSGVAQLGFTAQHRH